MRASNERDLLIYCLDLVYADPVPGHLSLSDLEPRMRCTKCGKRGADIRGSHWVAGWGERPKAKPWPQAWPTTA
jgi:hypothetical protein